MYVIGHMLAECTCAMLIHSIPAINIIFIYIYQTDSTDPEHGKAAPAVSILQSTERVANVIATTLSKTELSFTIARPNLGMPAHICI